MESIPGSEEAPQWQNNINWESAGAFKVGTSSKSVRWAGCKELTWLFDLGPMDLCCKHALSSCWPHKK
jgi:hypothetical protein